MNSQSNPARSIALVILFITTIASGFAMLFSSIGNHQVSLTICGGAIVLNLIVLIFGSVLVASSKLDNDE